jgi:hypothetical protein
LNTEFQRDTGVRPSFLVAFCYVFFLTFSPPPAANASGHRPFSLQRSNSTWRLVSPEDSPFFSVGVCVVTRGASRDELDPENPGYAAWQHYSNDRTWADTTLQRLRQWGFTTVGAWSDHKTLLGSSNMLTGLTPILHIGSTAGAPWWDMWDEKVIKRMDDVAREQILAVRDDPRLIGYYTDNEMGWWNATLFHMALEQTASSGQRQRLLKLLRETYQNDWGKLAADFDPEAAESFNSLEQRGQLWLKPGGRGIVVMRQFLGLMATRYYQLAHGIVRKYDRRALILGDRYQSFYYPEVARAAVPYVDAISSNLNANWNDGTYARCYLDTLYALTGKPIFISEFYMAASSNRSGNRNSHGVFPVVSTQRERAAALRMTLESLVREPFVVGADWFQYFDHPRHGREDGENYNFGLVDVFDRPYEEVTGAFGSMRLSAEKLQGPRLRLDASSGIPRAPRDPFANFVATQALRHWDRERGFVKPSSEFPVADLYVCWSPKAIYLGLYGFDIIEDAYYRNKSVPKEERALWTVKLGDGQEIRARIGGGREAIVNDPAVRLENLSGINLNVRNVAVLELPAKRFGRNRFRAGDSIDLNTSLLSHAQAYRVEWKGTFTFKN